MRDLYTVFGVYISIIPMIIGLINLKKLDPAFRVLVLMVICETLVSILSRWQQIQDLNNLPYLHFLTFFEFLLGSCFFYLTITNKAFKRIIFILSILFLGYTSINSFFIQDIYTYNQIPRMLEGYLFVLFGFLYFYELLKQPKVIQLSNSGEFWAVTAFFSYFGTTQFIHLFSGYLGSHYRDFYLILGDLNRTMVIIYYSILTIALWKKKSQTT